MSRMLMPKLLVLAAVAWTGPGARAQTPDWMKPGPGQEETAVSCGVCHTLSYIQMNSPFMKPATWKAEVDKMRGPFGAPIDDDTATAITGYLIKNYGAPATN